MQDKNLTIKVPQDAENPDFGLKGSLNADINNQGVATIRRINVVSLYENQGVGTELINKLKADPEVVKILANPSEEALRKQFYEKRGFQKQDDGWYIWHRQRE